jgi:hypothetical protein
MSSRRIHDGEVSRARMMTIPSFEAPHLIADDCLYNLYAALKIKTNYHKETPADHDIVLKPVSLKPWWLSSFVNVDRSAHQEDLMVRCCLLVPSRPLLGL